MNLRFSPQRAAHIYATGATTIILMGTLGCIAACLAAIWALVALAQLLLTGIVETSSAIGGIYAAADPMVRLLLIAGIAYVVYRTTRRAWRGAQA